MAHFKEHDVVPLPHPSRSGVIIAEQIGAGSQADVYRARDLVSGKYVAAKHCYGSYVSDAPCPTTSFSTEKELFHAKVIALARNSPPHPGLCWPLHVSALSSQKTFVYTMPLLEGYKSLSGVIKGTDPLPDHQKARLLDQLADIFAALHKSGFVYGDLSEANAMYRIEADGSLFVKLIDCDNVTLPGFSLGLEGSGKFRAPELLLPDPDREDGRPKPPSLQSDAYALALLAFRVFLRRHPLDGALARTAAADDTDGFLEHYAVHPRFIFDGDANAPSPTVRHKWDMLPRPMQAYFSEMFSQPSLHLKTPRPGADALRKSLAHSFPL